MQRLITRLRKAIMADTNARKIFHWNHILDTARLRSGITALKRKRAEKN